MSQRSQVNARRKAVLPLVRERQTLADSLARILAMLGLERKARRVQSLDEYIEQKYGANNRTSEVSEGSDSQDQRRWPA